MNKLEWIFEEQPPNGGAPGDAYNSALNGTGFETAQLVAREAIQNSVDAHDKSNRAVKIDFRLQSLSGMQRAAFEKSSCLEQMKEHLGALIPKPSLFSEDNEPLRLLYIDDYNTTGLHGDPTQNDSNFRKLLMNIGLSDKISSSHGSGGSYGLGKSVYSGNSRIQTIFVYSKTKNDKGEPISLLLGAAYQRHFSRADRIYTGRAWLGREVPCRHGNRIDPFLNTDADVLSKELGFVRDPNKLGTSILIIDADLQAENILQGIEDYWWPRIVDHQIEVDVVNEHGARLVPQPMRRPHLKPFIDAWNVAIKRSPPTSRQLQYSFNRYLGKALGSLGLVILDEQDGNSVFERKEDGDNEIDLGLETRIDSVALIRSPKMVVDYYRGWNPQRPAVVGAFMADLEIDHTLKLSEPPAHNKWDHNAARLKNEQHGQDIIKTLQRRIKERIRAFQKNAKPPEAESPKRIAELERELSKWLGSGSKAMPTVTRGESPVEIRYMRKPHVSPAGPSKILLECEISVSIERTQDVEDLSVRALINCYIIEEGGISEGSQIPLDVQEIKDGEQRSFTGIGVNEQIQLKKGHPVRLKIRTAPYDNRWTVKLVPKFESA